MTFRINETETKRNETIALYCHIPYVLLYPFLLGVVADVDNEDVLMSCNPAYVAMESYHQSRTEEATDESFHQPLSADTLCKDLV